MECALPNASRESTLANVGWSSYGCVACLFLCSWINLRLIELLSNHRISSYVVVEAFASLRSLPVGTYDTVSLVQMFPTFNPHSSGILSNRILFEFKRKKIKTTFTRYQHERESVPLGGWIVMADRMEYRKHYLLIPQLIFILYRLLEVFTVWRVFTGGCLRVSAHRSPRHMASPVTFWTGGWSELVLHGLRSYRWKSGFQLVSEWG